MRTIDWRDGRIVAVDQTGLPHDVRMLEIGTTAELVDAIKRLAIRGAPALGVAGALGVALAVRDEPEDRDRDIKALRAARPTAVNLAWGVDRALARLGDGPDAVLAEALEILEADVRDNRALARRGADWLLEHAAGPIDVQTHCNAGGLACVEWGTALGVLRVLRERGALGHVYVDETRPLLQGARLTTWELARLGIAHTLVVDAAGPSILARGLAGAVVVGADRVAANGDVINKVGTYPLALAAARAGAPFLVAAPESTIDPASPAGDAVEIEVRDPDELVHIGQTVVAPPGTATLNLAFDVTPADLVTAIVTERRLIRPARGERP
ncbi:MAG TPA: S-methyl-5-thioribose-1-phosphate isomerase [Actinophytocola sp.]|uniref:S-methyl-5-thioribose-1-phosphate isomerase n=1 Tax=Actinophytocola sp. TaxID=1872138 RepID=UPI002DDD2D9A|nr:S-methyl-5-thioribose-1-phosphate isomerase [Actinophytocola sp.]HEV2783307.1 S-methyl-5-thioribose-1-phosphate isomerase [Actinophytocola sp.]